MEIFFIFIFLKQQHANTLSEVIIALMNSGPNIGIIDLQMFCLC